jgi:murein DD-endopeptidase MepM/ murein hydrolase activator NlpD
MPEAGRVHAPGGVHAAESPQAHRRSQAHGRSQAPGRPHAPGRAHASQALARLLAVPLVLVLTLTLDGLTAPPAQAASLGPAIAAARTGQRVAATRMRRADRRLAKIERLSHTTKRDIRRAERRLERARRRFDAARDRVEAASDRLRLARQELDRATHVRPNPAGRQVGLIAGPRRDVRRARSDVRRLERKAARRDHARDRARRDKRQRLRAIGRSGRGPDGIVRKRERAESTLSYHIEVMARLAEIKAARRSMSRPAQTGFHRPARGRVTQGYGCTGYRREPRKGRCRHFHDGIDIASSPGTRIRAAAEGVVVYEGWSPWDHPRRAWIVILAHRGGLQTVYGHLKPVDRVKVGKPVRARQVIGYMGSTGNSTGPHLHWEVRRGWSTIDPGRFR